jgi:hypothetical protein
MICSEKPAFTRQVEPAAMLLGIMRYCPNFTWQRSWNVS